jgi:hypothetical protein
MRQLLLIGQWQRDFFWDTTKILLKNELLNRLYLSYAIPCGTVCYSQLNQKISQTFYFFKMDTCFCPLHRSMDAASYYLTKIYILQRITSCVTHMVDTCINYLETEENMEGHCMNMLFYDKNVICR